MKKKKIYKTKVLNAIEKIPPRQSLRTTTLDYYPLGTDNLFPQALTKLMMATPVLSSGIESKKDYTIGKGLTSDVVATQKWIKESKINKELSNIIFDKWAFGNAYMGIVWNRFGMKIYHWDSTMCRMGREENEGMVLIFPDWSQYSKNNALHQKLLKKIPVYPNYDTINGDNHSIIHINDYQPTYKIYGVPKYVSALKSAQINYKSDEWNVSKIDNQFQPGTILSAPVGSQKEADDLIEALEKRKGPLKNGEMFAIAKGMGASSVDLEFVRSENEGEWLSVRNLGREEIITALNWFSILLGQSTPGKLGQTQEIRNTYLLAMATVIEPEQVGYLEILQEVLTDFNIVPDLRFQNITPFSYTDKIDLNKVLTKRQALEMMGLPIDENREDLNELVNGTDNISNNKS